MMALHSYTSYEYIVHISKGLQGCRPSSLDWVKSGPNLGREATKTESIGIRPLAPDGRVFDPSNRIDT